MATIDLVELQKEIEAHNIFRRFHSSGQFSILNYTPNCSYSKHWTDFTRKCRGLIIDNSGVILSRPFEKFWNLSELPGLGITIPNEPFQAFEKMDGSMGISYWFNGKPYLSTRGGFESEQAIKGTQLLQTKYQDQIKNLNPAYTYIFEIIYPENRIVVDYGQEEKLVHLATIETETGREDTQTVLGFPVPAVYSQYSDLSTITQVQLANKEGFVLRFQSGFRVKVKFEEYLKIHRIVTDFSEKRVWEHLSNHTDVQALIEQVPDEFYDSMKNTVTKLQSAFELIENYCKLQTSVISTLVLSRKDAAELIKKTNYPSVIFAMYDSKKYDNLIWNLIKPKHLKPLNN